MTERRDVLRAIAAIALAGIARATPARPLAAAATGKVRVTLVRWPYT